MTQYLRTIVTNHLESGQPMQIQITLSMLDKILPIKEPDKLFMFTASVRKDLAVILQAFKSEAFVLHDWRLIEISDDINVLDGAVNYAFEHVSNPQPPLLTCVSKGRVYPVYYQYTPITTPSDNPAPPNPEDSLTLVIADSLAQALKLSRVNMIAFNIAASTTPFQPVAEAIASKVLSGQPEATIFNIATELTPDTVITIYGSLDTTLTDDLPLDTPEKEMLLFRIVLGILFDMASDI